MVIVTSRLFVIADAIKHIDLSDSLEEITHMKYQRQYRITVEYTRMINPGQSSNEEVHAVFYNAEDALECFRSIVHQYREQNPDQLYLDKIIERALEVGSKHMDVKLEETRKMKRRTKRIVRAAKTLASAKKRKKR